ncbi:hypothetical protein ACFFX0_10430 [Citricoccus parietis]|uniref:Ig-like domain-containing protein n=1 Tax=Citricoccus parietis TaxID=592307 RepID=A0ABV5FY40_9MICC
MAENRDCRAVCTPTGSAMRMAAGRNQPPVFRWIRRGVSGRGGRPGCPGELGVPVARPDVWRRWGSGAGSGAGPAVRCAASVRISCSVRCRSRGPARRAGTAAARRPTGAP